MQLNVSGHHVEITESMRDYVGVKIEKIARHFIAITLKKICTLRSTAW